MGELHVPDAPVPNEPPSTVVASRGRGWPKGKPRGRKDTPVAAVLNGDMGLNELQDILYAAFNMIALLLGSTEKLTKAEFELASRGLLPIVNRIERLRQFVRLFTPLTSTGLLVDKLRMLISSRTRLVKQDSASTDNHTT